MGIIRTALIVIIVIIVLMLIPKHYGGSVCFGCANMECSCLGAEKDFNFLGKERNACFGVPYKCEEPRPEPEE